MEEGRWDELIPDTLGLIFGNLGLEEILTVVPAVCQSWRRAVAGPYCWQEIDIEEWSRQAKPDQIDRLLRLLVTRSCGSLRKLCVSGVSTDSTFVFVADRAKSLQTLSLIRSDISNTCVEQVAGKLSALTFLDLSYCSKIGAPALEAIGKNCKHLTGLRRIMHPIEVVDKVSQDDEAMAIASTMPKLKHLEIAYLLVSTPSLIEVLTKCKDLELLDVRGCWSVDLDEDFVKKFPKLKLIGPHVTDYYDQNGWDSCSDYSDSSSYLAWDFVGDDIDDDYEEYGFNNELAGEEWAGEQPIEELAGMWFYNNAEQIEDGGEYDWPLSP